MRCNGKWVIYPIFILIIHIGNKSNAFRERNRISKRLCKTTMGIWKLYNSSLFKLIRTELFGEIIEAFFQPINHTIYIIWMFLVVIDFDVDIFPCISFHFISTRIISEEIQNFLVSHAIMKIPTSIFYPFFL